MSILSQETLEEIVQRANALFVAGAAPNASSDPTGRPLVPADADLLIGYLVNDLDLPVPNREEMSEFLLTLRVVTEMITVADLNAMDHRFIPVFITNQLLRYGRFDLGEDRNHYNFLAFVEKYKGSIL